MNNARNLRLRAHRLGLRAEVIAALLLRLKGYRILAMRLRTRGGEIDIVARKSRWLIIVEVKARASYEACAESITAQKRERLARAANALLAHPGALTRLIPSPLAGIRFDMVMITPKHLPRHLKDAWRPDNA